MQYGTYSLVTGPASEPVTLAEAKAHARIDSDTENDYITALIVAARELVCRLTGRAMITETWKLTLDRWPGDEQEEWWTGVRDGALSQLTGTSIEIRKAPFLALTSVEYLDEAGSATTVDSSIYYASPAPGEFGKVTLKRGQVWPVLYRNDGTVVVTFTRGYGSSASAVPNGLKHAIKMLVAHWYQNREPASDCASGTMTPAGFSALVEQFRVGR